MDWREKIRSLLSGKNASELARRVGLHPAAISRAAKKGEMPKADKGIKIARALGVSADWLYDDKQPWESKDERAALPSLAGAPDPEIVQELATRFKRMEGIFAKAMDDLKALHQGGRLEEMNPRDRALLQSHIQSCVATGRHYDSLFRAFLEVNDLTHELAEIADVVLGTQLARSQPRDLGEPIDEPMKDLPTCLVSHDDLTEITRNLFVPLIGNVAAGPPSRGEDGGYPVGVAETYIRFKSKDPNCFGCRVLGDSMEPDYPDGAVVICEPNRQRESGAVCVIVLKGGTEHALKVVKGQTMYSLNRAYPPVELTPDDEPRVYPVVAVFSV